MRTDNRIMKIVRRISLALVAILVLAVAGALSYRAWWQHRIANALRITSPNGIDEAKFIRVDGTDQWITIRGENKANPIILFLHGGPSEANSPFASLYRPFEKDYVFVQWDQPGAGKTYIKAGRHQPKFTLESMAADGIAVVEYLHSELPGPKIILIGQDWGGLLGLQMIRQRPDLFAAFVGTGQIVSLFAQQEKQFEYTRSRAAARHDEKVLASLSQMGPPPYRSLEDYRRFGEYFEPVKPQEDLACEGRLTDLLAVTPSLSITDVYYWIKALRSGEELLNPTLMREDLLKTGGVFSVPIFFIQGGDDVITPTSLVAEYVSEIQAPVKNLTIVPGAAHFVMWTRPAEFLGSLREDMRSTTAEH